MAGTITATAGAISGWDISGNTISKTDSGVTVELSSTDKVFQVRESSVIRTKVGFFTLTSTVLSNLILNGGIEDSTVGWTFAVAHTGGGATSDTAPLRSTASKRSGTYGILMGQ
jgi:hypothetical protein